MYDVIIVGAGPAGLNAALVLGRCRRRVLVCDSGRPRNAASPALHGFLSRDGVPPHELLRLGRAELRAYPSVEWRHDEVSEANCAPHGFEVVVRGGERFRGRKLLLATGVVDELPPVEGADTFYGRGVFHCPYCDGWEVRDQPLAVYGRGHESLQTARVLLCWSRDVVLCTDGPSGLSAEDCAFLERHRIRLYDERIERLEGGATLERLVLAGGRVLERRALFFETARRQHSDLAPRLGCDLTPKAQVRTNKLQLSNVDGVYVAGDAGWDVQLVIVAAADGARAAFAINTALLEEDFA